MRDARICALVLGLMVALAGCGEDTEEMNGGGAGGMDATGGVGGDGGDGGAGGEVGEVCGDVTCDPIAVCAGVLVDDPQCRCPFGYIDVNGDGTVCEDRDECAIMESEGVFGPKGGRGDDFPFCDEDATCINLPGTHVCTCNPGFEDINGDGTRCEDIDECDAETGTAECDENATCLNLPGSFQCRCNCGFTGDGETCSAGGCDCSATFTFVHSEGAEDSEQDCITSDVCLSRGLQRGLFNAATEAANVSTNSRFDPEGTLWASVPCAQAGSQANDTEFVPFREALDFNVGNNFDSGTICLHLTRTNLFYDVDITSWQSSGGGAFTYERTAAFSDECGHGDAVCGSTCECPAGFDNDPDTGICEYPDPCDPSPCGAGAECLRTGPDSHVCLCDVTEFVKDDGVDTCDDINENVCLTRNGSGPLFNSVVDENAGAAQTYCNEGREGEPGPEPTHTVWAGSTCADASPGDFGPFVSDSLFRECRVGDKVFDGPICLSLTDGSNEQWDVLFRTWCSNGNGDCFGYLRSRNVADGEACE